MLYKEDLVDEQITDEKISKTIRELDNNPRRGKIIIFEKASIVIGYVILIFYWSNEFGGDILQIDELYVKTGTETTWCRNKLLQLCL